jgi:hypothetical protein
VYEISVREVVTELTDDGTAPTLIDCARYVTEADCPWHAVIAWAEQLEAEERPDQPVQRLRGRL